MIYPKHRLFFPLLFRLYSKIGIKRNFAMHEIICRNEVRTDLPVLLVSNHISWWDGFWMVHLNACIWKRKFHVLMDEASLAENKWLNYAGAFSLDRRAIRESMQLCERILQNKEHLLLYFPQGRFQSLYDNQLRFKRGADYLIRETPGDFDIILVANVVEYNCRKKPAVKSYCMRINKSQCQESLEELYGNFYNESIQHHILYNEP